MLKAYGQVGMSFNISSSGGGAVALTDTKYMNDGKSGIVTSLMWDTGTQSLTTYTEIRCNLTPTLDTTQPWGAIGLVNVQGLPAGTLVKLYKTGPTLVASQRLVAGARGELSAWFVYPGYPVNDNTVRIRIYNDVNGSDSIAASTVFGVGECFVGRVTAVPSLMAGRPQSDLIDSTAFNRTNQGQLYQLMRAPWRVCQAQLGVLAASSVGGGPGLSKIASGGNPAGFIDVKTLRDYLATTLFCAVCDLPSAGGGAGTVVNGIRYDQDFMQPNWMLARPSAIGSVIADLDPYWTWNPQYMEAR